MKKLYKGYVETRDKKCVEKFKDRTDFKTLKQVQSLPEYAGILAEDTIFVDIDNATQAEKLMQIVEALKLRCRVIATRRGKHFIFKNHTVKHCKTHTRLAVGLTADIKVGYVASYEVLKTDGKVRPVEWDIDPGEEYQELPRWLLPVKSRTDFSTLGAGDGRNDAIFAHILALQAAGLSIEESREAIRLLNQFVLPDPLGESELETIMREEAFQKPTFIIDGKFSHNEVAKYLKNTMHVVMINKNLFIYRDGVYVGDKDAIEAEIHALLPELTNAKRQEILKALMLLCVREPVQVADARYIAFRNGIYDVLEGKMRDFSPDIVITNKIPWDYNENAQNELMDHTLDKLSCGDREIRALLEECVGYCFYRRNELRTAFILVGDKANGKSTFLDLIKAVLGHSNYSVLDLKELGDRFSTVMIFGKLANIGDDISSDFMQGSQVAVFKKVVTGNEIKAERKGQDGFSFEPYAKLLFSANDIPRMRDRSGAVLSRLCIIPFNARFSKNEPDYDPFIKYKLIEQEPLEYLIRIGMEGLRRVLKNNAFSRSEKVKKQMEEYEVLNDSILAFVHDLENGEEDIVNESTSDIFKRYQVFCNESNLQPVARDTFSKEINRKFGIVSKLKRVNGKPMRVFLKE